MSYHVMFHTAAFSFNPDSAGNHQVYKRKLNTIQFLNHNVFSKARFLDPVGTPDSLVQVELKEKLLMFGYLKTTTKALDVLKQPDDFFESYNLSRNHVNLLCTERAPSMVGATSDFVTSPLGFVTSPCSERSQALSRHPCAKTCTTHCFLQLYFHLQALSNKTLREFLKTGLQQVTQSVKYIRARVLDHRLFQLLCYGMGSDHTVLIFHTEGRITFQKPCFILSFRI